MLAVEITRLPHAEDLPLPSFETPGAVGFDFLAAKEVNILPGEIARIPSGLIIKTPEGYALIIAPRSSTPVKKKLDMPHSLGIIDQDYCGPADEILIQVRNFSTESVTVKRGEKIAQGLFVAVSRASWQEKKVHEVAAPTRGGFGSTDSGK
jgi:dUTP pyrophosphatase